MRLSVPKLVRLRVRPSDRGGAWACWLPPEEERRHPSDIQSALDLQNDLGLRMKVQLGPLFRKTEAAS